MRGPRVSIATGCNIKSGGREKYLVSFLFEAVSAALPAEWDVECRYESARVLTTVTFHFRGLPPCLLLLLLLLLLQTNIIVVPWSQKSFKST